MKEKMDLEDLRCYRVDGSQLPKKLSRNFAGVAYRSSPVLEDMNRWSVAPWNSIVWGKHEDNFVKVGNCYLPMVLQEVPVLVQTNGASVTDPNAFRFRVDGRKVDKSVSCLSFIMRCGPDAKGLPYHKGPATSELDEYNYAPWESVVFGTLDGEFVKVGGRYLPMYLDGNRVLKQLDDKPMRDLAAVESANNFESCVRELSFRIADVDKRTEELLSSHTTDSVDTRFDESRRLLDEQHSKLKTENLSLSSRIDDIGKHTGELLSSVSDLESRLEKLCREFEGSRPQDSADTQLVEQESRARDLADQLQAENQLLLSRIDGIGKYMEDLSSSVSNLESSQETFSASHASLVEKHGTADKHLNEQQHELKAENKVLTLRIDDVTKKSTEVMTFFLRLEARFEQLGKDFERLEARLEEIGKHFEERLTGIQADNFKLVNGLTANFASFESRLNHLVSIQSIESPLAGMEARSMDHEMRMASWEEADHRFKEQLMPRLQACEAELSNKAFAAAFETATSFEKQLAQHRQEVSACLDDAKKNTEASLEKQILHVQYYLDSHLARHQRQLEQFEVGRHTPSPSQNIASPRDDLNSLPRSLTQTSLERTLTQTSLPQSLTQTPRSLTEILDAEALGPDISNSSKPLSPEQNQHINMRLKTDLNALAGPAARVNTPSKGYSPSTPRQKGHPRSSTPTPQRSSGGKPDGVFIGTQSSPIGTMYVRSSDLRSLRPQSDPEGPAHVIGIGYMDAEPT